MHIVHPSHAQLSERNRLLQLTMRPDPLPYGIEQEYPLVLCVNRAELSLCGIINNKVVAHANLWPRRLTSTANDIQIGLIGNVATSPTQRGKGYAQQLIAHCMQIAHTKNLAGLVLWSDLLTFYQKLGFRSLCQERRYTFAARHILPAQSTSLSVSYSEVDDHSNDELSTMLSLRPDCVTLERSLDEFRKLLTIPDCHLFTCRTGGELVAFAIVGKGYDMAGVIHEWGASSGRAFQQIIAHIFRVSGWSKVLCLAPNLLARSWEELFESWHASVEYHPMALIWLRNNSVNEAELSQLFVWGLDAI